MLNRLASREAVGADGNGGGGTLQISVFFPHPPSIFDKNMTASHSPPLVAVEDRAFGLNSGDRYRETSGMASSAGRIMGWCEVRKPYAREIYNCGRELSSCASFEMVTWNSTSNVQSGRYRS